MLTHRVCSRLHKASRLRHDSRRRAAGSSVATNRRIAPERRGPSRDDPRQQGSAQRRPSRKPRLGDGRVPGPGFGLSSSRPKSRPSAARPRRLPASTARGVPRAAWPRSCRSSSVLASRSDSKRPHLLGIARVLRLRLHALAFELFHPLLDARVGVDQSFASVTHECSVRPQPIVKRNRHYKMRIVSARAISDPLAPFHPAVREWFERVVRRADAPADARLAGDRARRIDADPRADRQRQDARGVPVVPRSPDVRAAAAEKTAAAACSTSRRSRRSPSTSSATCGRRSPGIAQRRRARAATRSSRRPSPSAPATRRSRARAVPARAGRHPDHDARIALPAADLERARGAARRRHGHHRRDSRAGADQARRAPGALARTARGALRAGRRSASACRRRSARSTKSRGFSAAPRSAESSRRQSATSQAARADQRPRRQAAPTSTIDARSATSSRRTAAPSATGPSPSSTPARRRR